MLTNFSHSDMFGSARRVQSMETVGRMSSLALLETNKASVEILYPGSNSTAYQNEEDVYKT